MKKFFIFILILWTAQLPTQLIARENLVESEKKFIAELETLIKQKTFEQAIGLFESQSEKYKNSLLVDYWGAKSMLGFQNFNDKYSEEEAAILKERYYKEAIRRFDKVIFYFEKNYTVFNDIKEKLLDALFFTAMAHYFIGNREMAVTYYDRYIKIHDKNKNVWFNKAAIYEELGNLVEANRAYIVYEKLGQDEEDEF